MVGWHHRLDGHEFEQTPGVGAGPGGLARCSPWGRRESDSTERLTATVHGKLPRPTPGGVAPQLLRPASRASGAESRGGGGGCRGCSAGFVSILNVLLRAQFHILSLTDTADSIFFIDKLKVKGPALRGNHLMWENCHRREMHGHTHGHTHGYTHTRTHTHGHTHMDIHTHGHTHTRTHTHGHTHTWTHTHKDTHTRTHTDTHPGGKYMDTHTHTHTHTDTHTHGHTYTDTHTHTDTHTPERKVCQCLYICSALKVIGHRHPQEYTCQREKLTWDHMSLQACPWGTHVPGGYISLAGTGRLSKAQSGSRWFKDLTGHP